MSTLHDDLIAIASDKRFVTPEGIVDAILDRIKAESPIEDNRAYLCECLGSNCTIHTHAAGYNKGLRAFGAVIEAARTRTAAK